MSFAAIFTLILLVAAAVLLVSDKLRPDLIALSVMVILGLSGIVTQTQVFSGFGGSAVMTLVGISIISEGLRQTGVTLALGNFMSRVGGKSESLLILAALVVSVVLSLFMNNIAVVGVLLPAVMAASTAAAAAGVRHPVGRHGNASNHGQYHRQWSLEGCRIPIFWAAGFFASRRSGGAGWDPLYDDGRAQADAEDRGSQGRDTAAGAPAAG